MCNIDIEYPSAYEAISEWFVDIVEVMTASKLARRASHSREIKYTIKIKLK